MGELFILFRKIASAILNRLFRYKRMGFCGSNVNVSLFVRIAGIKNMYMYDNTNIYAGAKIICTRAKFIMKKNSGAAEGLTVVTGGHLSIVGKWFKDISDRDKDILDKDGIEDKDIMVEEDVWIGTNVTLLKGVVVGRGAIIGSGAVCRSPIPPYAIVVGNPAKIVGFRFNPQEVSQHEEELYPESQRLSSEYLEKNYKKYFIDKRNEIKNFIKL